MISHAEKEFLQESTKWCSNIWKIMIWKVQRDKLHYSIWYRHVDRISGEKIPPPKKKTLYLPPKKIPSPHRLLCLSELQFLIEFCRNIWTFFHLPLFTYKEIKRKIQPKKGGENNFSITSTGNYWSFQLLQRAQKHIWYFTSILIQKDTFFSIP